MEPDYQEIELYKMAQKRIKKIKDFYVHLIVYIVINSLIFLQNSNVFNQFEINFNFGNSNLFFWWGIGILAHWASVFGSNLFLGKNWEEKKIKEILDKQKQDRSKWE